MPDLVSAWYAPFLLEEATAWVVRMAHEACLGSSDPAQSVLRLGRVARGRFVTLRAVAVSCVVGLLVR